MKKTGLIALAVVLALGAMGVGLAWWDEVLTINGTVATGNFDTEFANITCDDNETPPDVGTIAVSTPGPADSFTVTIGNGYPCYTGTAEFDVVVSASGTIPAKIKSIKVDGVDYTGAVDKNLSGTANKDIRITITGIAVDQALPVVDAQVIVHVIEKSVENLGYDADENVSGSFTVTIETTQFNAS